jgi:hypothetical protein
MDEQLLPALTSVAEGGNLVSFPFHRGGYHAEPVAGAGLFTCPAVVGGFKLQPDANKLRPCQTCSFCLP